MLGPTLALGHVANLYLEGSSFKVDASMSVPLEEIPEALRPVRDVTDGTFEL